MSKKSGLLGIPMPKDAISRAGQFLIRSGTTVGAAYLSNSMSDEKYYPKAHGAIFTLLGLAGEFFEQPHLRAAAQGIGAYGALRLTGDILKEKKSKIGLAGSEDQVSGVGAFDWKQIADEAERIANAKSASMAGNENQVAGIGETDQVSGTGDEVSGLGASDTDTAMLLN